MSIQTKASFKREALAFYRTGRLLIVSLVIIGLAMFGPLFITGLGSLINSMSDIYSSFGMDVSGMTEALTEASSTGVASSVTDITGTGLIVFLLLINYAAGGEQKKRDIIIPRSAGLRSFGYLFPKYIIYPLSAFVLTVIAMFVSWGVSSRVFDVNDLLFGQVLLAGVLSGMCMMFYICFHITLGTATGRPGMSAAVCICASIILPNMFAFAGSNYMFNPFALDGLAGTVITQPEMESVQMRDIFVTIVFALALLVLSYLIALFVQNAKRIDNTGDEMEL